MKPLAILLIALLYCNVYLMADVTFTEKQMVIPTYEVLAADKNPYFFKGEVYQGASRKVYPYPFLDNLSDNVIDKEYKALILENEYIEICVAPELGGRLYYAKDKTNGYYFIYYNQVVKPALIGMAGSWVSGGVEWNIPHHHRASTFLPVDYEIQKNEDGSQTIWVGETELRHRTRWLIGLTLHSGKAYIETTMKILNTTPEQHSILAWANAAMHTNVDYQIIFPPLTQYGTFHKKSEFSEWPVSHQFYRGSDYTSGVNLSFWKNHSKKNSWFAWEPQGNFVAGYDWGQKAGTLIFGDEDINIGKKVWSWGNYRFGELWDKLLSDEDGPYIELMFGSFSNNQPDYSWIHPFETKESTYYFMPTREIPSVKKANTHGFVDLEKMETHFRFGVYSSTVLKEAEVLLMNKQGKTVFSKTVSIDPSQPFMTDVSGLNEYPLEDLKAVLINGGGDSLITYQPKIKPNKPMPKAVEMPNPPDQIHSADSLYFTGLRIEQFYDPQFDHIAFYRRALQLNADHVKANLRMGIHYFKRGLFAEAELHFFRVVQRVTWNYTHPEDAESLYYLGLVKSMQGDDESAKALWAKAAWDYEWFSASHYELAKLQCRRNHLQKSLDHLERSLSTNMKNIDALLLKATILRRSNHINDAQACLQQAIALDPLHLKGIYEKALLSGHRVNLNKTAFSGVQSMIELAVKYGGNGFFDEAIDVLKQAESGPEGGYPMIHYLLAWYHNLAGNPQSSTQYLMSASKLSSDYCFPFRHEERAALHAAVLANQQDARAWLYLGNAYYDHQPGKAINCWEKSLAINKNTDAQINRNLAYGYANHQKKYIKAADQMLAAIEKDATDPRYYYELDMYNEQAGVSIADRLKLLVPNADVLARGNPSRIQYFVLLVLAERYQDAMDFIQKVHIRKWEGSDAAFDYWVYLNVIRADQEMDKGHLSACEMYLANAVSDPKYIDVPVGDTELIAIYYEAKLNALKGLHETARFNYEKLTSVKKEINTELQFFVGMAHKKVGHSKESKHIFSNLIAQGENMLEGQAVLDYFNPFARVKTEAVWKSDAYYLLALGYLGQGNLAKARELHLTALKENPNLMDFVFRLHVDSL